MELIERHYYQEAMRRIDEEEKDPQNIEKFEAMLQEYRVHMEGHSYTIDTDKIDWFEGLAGAVLEFAKALDLDVKMWTSNDCFGFIQFETSYFEFDLDMEPHIILEFWNYLCNNAKQFSISNGFRVSRIEFIFILHGGA